MGATKYLVTTRQLFQSERLEVQETWLNDPDTFIHSSDPVPEITFSEATQRHDNYTGQLLVTDCNDSDDMVIDNCIINY